MSSSAAGQKHTSDFGWTVAFRSPFQWRLALTLGATATPVAVFAVLQNSSAALVGALTAMAIAAILLCTTLVFTRHKKRQSASVDPHAFDLLVEYVREAVLQFDAEGGLVLVSPSAESLFGCAKYELSGNGTSERVHVLDRPLYLTAFSKAQHSGTEQTIEVRMRRDGVQPGQAVPEYVWIEIAFSPLKAVAAAAAPFGVMALMRDISQRKENEQRIFDAHKAAESASHAKSQFLAVIGHELRTPLNAIVGFSDMMLSDIGGKLTPTHSEYAGHISESGRHLLEVVNMLLDMSKIEAGRFELRTDHFEPESLVAPCIQIVSKAAQEKNVELDVKLGRQLPEIIGDERACRQMVINLLSNAIKFTNSGGKVTWSIKQQGNSLALAIADTGIGMAEDVLQRLGEPFFQAENTAERRYEGTGLGISIVKGLADLHDGELKVVSQPGQGTTITLLLPLEGPQSKRQERVTVLHPNGAAASHEWPEQKRMIQ